MLNGGAGNDMFYFAASFTEYELSRDPDTGNIIVSRRTRKTAPALMSWSIWMTGITLFSRTFPLPVSS